MARIRPVGTGGPSHGDHHPRRKSHKSRAHHPRGKHPRVKHPRATRPPASHAPTAEPVHVRSAWLDGAPPPGVISPLLALDPAALPAPDPLALTGAQHGAIHEPGDPRGAFDAWSRQRDQALNRVARRPGGLVRLAGV